MKGKIHILIIVLTCHILICGCGYFSDIGVRVGETSSDNDGPSEVVNSVSSYFSSLPDWANFYTPKPSSKVIQEMKEEDCSPENIEKSEGQDKGDVCVQKDVRVSDIPTYDDKGDFVGYTELSYNCRTTKYTLISNPEKIVMFSPDVEILWPGALIQGKSHKHGKGALLGLPIRERNPIKVSIPALANEKNFVLVKNPELATVNQAIGEMILTATTQDLKTPSTITFNMRDYRSEEEFALSLGMSGKYLGFKASASASVETNEAEHTVAVLLYQKMFEVVVEPPQTPASFFSKELTVKNLQEQINLGKIGANNIPLYVSNIVYGRMMMFTLTSTASSSEIRAALNASYKGLGASSKIHIETRHKKILSESKISVTSLGGHSAATEAMIASGDWRSYFYVPSCKDPNDHSTCTYSTRSAPLTSAAPLSYTFRDLGRGAIAKVSDTATYNIRECNAISPKVDFVSTSFDIEDDPSTKEDERIEGWSTLPPRAWKGSKFSDLYSYETSIVLHGISASIKNDKREFVWYFRASNLFLGNKLDFYGGELSYWIKWLPYKPTMLRQINTYDVIIIGGRPDSSITLTYIYPDGNPPKDAYYHKKIPLSNKGCKDRRRSCWELGAKNVDATEAQIQYALENIISLYIRGKYGWDSIMGVDNYGYLDEVIMSKPSVP